MSITTTRVLVRFVDQPLDIMFPIARNGSGCTQSGTDEFVINDKYAEIKSRDEFFYDHTAAVLFGGLKRFQRLLPGGNICSVAFAVIAIDRFDHDRITDAIDHRLQTFLCPDHIAFWNWYFSRTQ